MQRLFFIFFSCTLFNLVYSQSEQRTIGYNNLVKYKVDEDRFEFGWLGNVFGGTPCFRNYTKNKIQSQLINPKTDSVIYTSSDQEINGLKIIAKCITLDKKSRILQINGQITGAWESVIPSEFEIYVGHRIDTISDITLSPSLEAKIYYNGAKLDSTVVVNRVPAFYLTDIKKFNAYRGTKNLTNSEYKEMLFDISSVIDDKSVLVFGLSSRYAEIFEIGKLLLLNQ